MDDKEHNQREERRSRDTGEKHIGSVTDTDVQFLKFCFKCSVTCKSEGTTILFYYITYCIHDCTIRICITGLFVVVIVVLAVFLQVEATV